MTDDYSRVIPAEEPPCIAVHGAPSKAARLAASIADLLDLLAEESGGRDDLARQAKDLREEFCRPTPSQTVKIDFVEIVGDDGATIGRIR